MKHLSLRSLFLLASTRYDALILKTRFPVSWIVTLLSLLRLCTSGSDVRTALIETHVFQATRSPIIRTHNLMLCDLRPNLEKNRANHNGDTTNM